MNGNTTCTERKTTYQPLVPSPGDWSSWYYVKKLLVDVPTDSPLLSLIPEQGPFHVTLNAHETAVELHRFFFCRVA